MSCEVCRDCHQPFYVEPDLEVPDHGMCWPCASTILDKAEDEIAQLTKQRDAARVNARILVHAYDHDSRPPSRVLTESRLYPVEEGFCDCE